MDEPSLIERIEQQIAERAGLDVAVELSGTTVTLSGRIDTAAARQAAHDVVKSMMPEAHIDDNLEIEETMPLDVREFDLDEPGGELPSSLAEMRIQSAIEPDFSEQPLVTSTVEMAGEASAALDQPDASETVFFAPTDPVIMLGEQNQVEVLGGFAPTAGADIVVEPSALDDQPGDEALAEAIRRELRRDAATTDLTIAVTVRRGVAHLRGTVATLEDAENAEAVASQVPGLREVVEELEVAAL